MLLNYSILPNVLMTIITLNFNYTGKYVYITMLMLRDIIFIL